MKVYLVKQSNNSFIAANEHDYESTKKIKVGSIVLCEIKQPRNIDFHRKVFLLIAKVYENQEIFNNSEYMRKEITKLAGYYDTYKNHKGIMCYEAQSISFAKMDQPAFETFFNRFLDAIEEMFGMDSELLKQELEDDFLKKEEYRKKLLTND